MTGCNEVKNGVPLAFSEEPRLHEDELPLHMQVPGCPRARASPHQSLGPQVVSRHLTLCVSHLRAQRTGESSPAAHEGIMVISIIPLSSEANPMGEVLPRTSQMHR